MLLNQRPPPERNVRPLRICGNLLNARADGSCLYHSSVIGAEFLQLQLAGALRRKLAAYGPAHSGSRLASGAMTMAELVLYDSWEGGTRAYPCP